MRAKLKPCEKEGRGLNGNASRRPSESLQTLLNEAEPATAHDPALEPATARRKRERTIEEVARHRLYDEERKRKAGKKQAQIVRVPPYQPGALVRLKVNLCPGEPHILNPANRRCYCGRCGQTKRVKTLTTIFYYAGQKNPKWLCHFEDGTSANAREEIAELIEAPAIHSIPEEEGS